MADKVYVYYNPRLENPPRLGPTWIEWIRLEPDSLNSISKEDYQLLANHEYGKLLQWGAVKQVVEQKQIEAVTIADKDIEKAKELVLAEKNVERLKQWRKTEQREEVRLLINNRIKELSALG